MKKVFFMMSLISTIITLLLIILVFSMINTNGSKWIYFTIMFLILLQFVMVNALNAALYVARKQNANGAKSEEESKKESKKESKEE